MKRIRIGLIEGANVPSKRIWIAVLAGLESVCLLCSDWCGIFSLPSGGDLIGGHLVEVAGVLILEGSGKREHTWAEHGHLYTRLWIQGCMQPAERRAQKFYCETSAVSKYHQLYLAFCLFFVCETGSCHVPQDGMWSHDHSPQQPGTPGPKPSSSLSLPSCTLFLNKVRGFGRHDVCTSVHLQVCCNYACILALEFKRKIHVSLLPVIVSWWMVISHHVLQVSPEDPLVTVMLGEAGIWWFLLVTESTSLFPPSFWASHFRFCLAAARFHCFLLVQSYVLEGCVSWQLPQSMTFS